MWHAQQLYVVEARERYIDVMEALKVYKITKTEFGVEVIGP